ncbi:MAG: exodeoxyribonuclease VII small subunit [Thermotogae bacterium]|nr:exodeoxyribonuclease VII small subunit [Thermotogota bacterium]HDM70637.1 exodeoxyribonuclease VII small subunit [Thermotogales bacterium]
MDFETAFNRLEEIVRKLENDEISLEESLELFQEGVKLYRFCREKLEKAKLKVMDVLKEMEEGYERIEDEQSQETSESQGGRI